MLERRAVPILALLLILIAGCSKKSDRSITTHLTGRAVLLADTIIPGPPTGIALDAKINGRSTPLPGVPVQGFSSILHQAENRYLVLQDNGFGTLANIPDFPFHCFHLTIELAINSKTRGKVTLEDQTFITDPNHHIADAPENGQLTGAHLDPESFVRLQDGSFWIGEEFGPSLVHVDSLGHVLAPPVDIPVVPDLAPFSRDLKTLMTPDHPILRHEAEASHLANMPRSGGIEGLALTPDGAFIYASVEKAMIEDPSRNRRVILQFNPANQKFTGNYHLYQVDAPNVSIASMEAMGSSRMLLLERDSGEGMEAIYKRIYEVDFNDKGPDGTLNKKLVCDLMKIRDKVGLTTVEDGAIGLGTHYSFPYVTPECLLSLANRTILVANDNNYPLSSGRRPPNTPDDNEFIRLRLDHKLKLDKKPRP